MGVSAYSTEVLWLRNYVIGSHPKVTMTEGSSNTQLTLWYVVNFLTQF